MTEPISIGTMPSGMPADIDERSDYEAAMEIIAEDINRACDFSDGQNGFCSLSRQLREVNGPVDFQALYDHIPATASYTPEEVLSLYCTIAAVAHDSTPIDDSDLGVALDATENTKNAAEYTQAVKQVSVIMRELEKDSQNVYSELWSSSVS